MNKYTLTFKDKNLENDYQKRNLSKNYNSLKVITFALLISMSARFCLAMMESDIKYIIYFISTTFYLLAQLFIISRKKQHSRAAIAIINHITSLYLFAENDNQNPQMTMLLGINQMAFTILLVLSGEYVDGVITIFNLTIFRVVWTSIYGNDLQYSALVQSFILLYYISYFNYQFHQGKRSQYILQFVDSHWEEVLQKLSTHSPYLIIQFEEENLSFSIKNNHCERIIENNEKQKKDFLQNSMISGKPLKNYIFNQILQHKQQNNQPQEIILNYQKQSYLIEMCFYQVKQLNVLLIFKDFDTVKQQDIKIHKKRNDQLCKILVHILTQLLRITTRKTQYINLQRKILILYLYDNIKMNQEYRKLTFYLLLDKVVYYCQNLKINLHIVVPADLIIHTHPKLFYLIMLIIFDNSSQYYASINCKIEKNRDIKLYLKGDFDHQIINELFECHKQKIQILFKDIQINKSLITLTHKSEIFIPFHLNID